MKFSSNVYTLQSDEHQLPSSESPPPMPERTNPDPIVNNTSEEVDSPQAFDQTITPMIMAYQCDAEENLYIQNGFSTLDAEVPSADGDLDWQIVRKFLVLLKTQLSAVTALPFKHL